MNDLLVIDADGHVLEREVDIRKHLEPPWDRRSTPLRPGDQPWDNNMFDSFEMARLARPFAVRAGQAVA